MNMHLAGFHRVPDLATGALSEPVMRPREGDRSLSTRILCTMTHIQRQRQCHSIVVVLRALVVGGYAMIG